MIGTDAMSRPLIELDSRRSAADRNSQGRMISTQANTASQRQSKRRASTSLRSTAMGSRTTAPPATRAKNENRDRFPPPSATLIEQVRHTPDQGSSP